MADDAAKRMRLRRHGYVPLVVTHADLDEHTRRGDAGGAGQLPPLLEERTVRLWEASGARARDHASLLRATPLELLLDVLRRGSTQGLRYVASELPQLLVNPADRSSLTAATPDAAPRLAADVLDGRTLPPQGSAEDLAVARRSEQLAAIGVLAKGARGMALVLDDRDRSVREDGFLDSWRVWGRLANLAQGDPAGSTVCLTTVSLLAAGIDVRSDSHELAKATQGAESLRPDHLVPGTHRAPAGASSRHPAYLDPAWAHVLEEAITEQERQVIRLASSLGIEAPTVGEEYGRGVPLDVAWPDRRAAYVAEELAPQELEALQTEGWNIVGPSTVDVLEELGLTEGTAS